MDIDRFEATIHSVDGVLPLQEFVSHFKFKPGHGLKIVAEPTSKATEAQNDQQHAWFKAAEKQGDMTAQEYRADAKAFCGVPILIRDSAEFREKYERIVKPLPYEHKLALMVEPFDFPVTRLMNKRQKSEYLDRVFRRLTTEHQIHLEAS